MVNDEGLVFLVGVDGDGWWMNCAEMDGATTVERTW